MKISKRASLITVGLLAVLVLALWWALAASRGPAYKIDGRAIDRGQIKASVSASGTVTPQGSVSVGSQVSGQVMQVLVDFNDAVKAGQVLARIDPSTFDQRVRQAMADVDAAQAQVQVQVSQAGARRAEVSRARVNLADARRDYARKRDLLARGFISTAERDAALTIRRTRREDLRAANAAARVVSAQIDNANAIVAQREAALANARVDAQRTIVRSPIDGIVIKRTVDAGQTVAASLQAPELFVIARNLTDMRVEASVDESDIGQIREGMPVSFSVDAFASQSFVGEVEQIRVSAEDSQSVISYTVVATFENRGTRLLPGMTANVQITVAERADVLRIPNSALRVRAPAELLAKVAGNRPVAAPKKGRGRLARARKQLVDAVKPSADQQQSIDDIFKRAGARFRGAMSLPEGQRKAGFRKVRQAMRQQISQVLSPEQIAAWRVVAGTGPSTSASTAARAYVVENNTLKPVDFRAGITDGSFTEVISGIDASARVAVSVKALQEAGGGPMRMLRLFR